MGDSGEKGDIARDPGTDLGVGIVHEASTVLDNEDRTSECLDIGKRFEKNLGFGNQFGIRHWFSFQQRYSRLSYQKIFHSARLKFT